MKRLATFILTLFILTPVLASGDNSKTTIFLIGDSTTADKDLSKQNTERGWGHYLPSLLDEEVAVRNFARNGRSSKSFILEGLWEQVENQIKKGDYLFIQFGHNDKKQGEKRFAAPYGEYTDNLELFVQTAIDKGATPIVLSPIERRLFDENGNLENTHGDYPEAARKVAEKYNIPFIDMTAVTNKWLTELGDTASRPYFMIIEPGVSPRHPDGIFDNTHLNVQGARAVAEMVTSHWPDLLPGLAAHLTDYDFVVAKDGSGDFFTVQEAINAAPDYNKHRATRIYIRNGIYNEKIVVPANKNNVHIIGQDVNNTIITHNDYASKIGSLGFEIGTSGTATVFIHAVDFTAENITFENSAGQVGQAVAVAAIGDRMHFRNCRFLGNQDTLYTFSPGSRQYYENCYIEGTTDFIFGFSIALFDDCEIHSKRDSYITAASTPQGQKYGYVFRNCKLTASENVSKMYLGRPWRPYAKTVFIECEMGGFIRAEGWHNWSKPDAEKTSYYAEYKSYGPGANPQSRVRWSHQLTEKQARMYTIENILGGNDNWDPSQPATSNDNIR